MPKNLDGIYTAKELEPYKQQNIMKLENTPTWWTNEHEWAWDRVKAAFQRDWDQTKHDLGGKRPDTNQNVDNTVKQAAGTEAIPPMGQPVFEEAEPAYRFGYGARSYYHGKYPIWNDALETQLEEDWSQTTPDGVWNEDVRLIRKGWDHKK